MFIILEDTKGVIRSRKSKKYRQYNGQKKKDKQIEQTNLTKTGVKSGAPGR